MGGWRAVSLRLLVLLVVALLLLGAGLVAVAQLRPQWLAGPLEWGLGRVLERRVEIGSLEGLELGRDVFVQVSNLRIANPPWADEPWLMDIDRLRLELALPSLWQAGPVVIYGIHLAGFEVNLLAPDDHPPSWRFREKATAAEEPPRRAAGPPVIVHHGRLQEGVLRYRDPDQDVRVALTALEIADPGGSEPLSLRLNGVMDGAPFSGAGAVGPASALLTGRDLVVDLGLDWGQLQLQLAGSLGDVATLERPDLQLAVTAPRARPLLDALGMSEVRDGPLRLDARLGTGVRGVSLDVDGSLGEFTVALEGAAERPLKLDDLELRFQLSGPSLQELGAALEVAGLPSAPFEISGEVERAGALLELRSGRLVVGGSELDFEGRFPEFPGVGDGRLDLAGRGLDVRLLGPLLDSERLPELPFEAQGTLRPGEPGTALVDLELTNPATRLVLDGSLRSGPGWQGSQVRLELSGADLNASLGMLAGRPLPPSPFEVAGVLASSADGFRLSEGHVRLGALGLSLAVRLEALAGDGALHAEFTATTPDLAASLLDWGVSAGPLEPVPMTVRGEVGGSPERLRLLSASVEAGAVRGRAQGLIGNPADLAELEVDVALSGPNLGALLTLPGPAGAPALPFRLEGAIAAEASGWGFRQFAGEFAGAQLELDAVITDAEGFQGSRLAVSLAGDSLAEVLDPWMAQDLPADPFSLALDLVYQGDLVTVPRADATLGDITLSAQLDLSHPARLGDTRGALTMRGPSARGLLRLLGADPELPDGPVRADVLLQGDREGLRLSEIDVTMADSDLSGTAEWRFARDGRRPEIDLDLHSQRLYLPFVLPPPPEVTAEEPAAERQPLADGVTAPLGRDDADERPGRAGGAERLIPDAPVNLGWLHRVNGRLRYRVDDLVLREDLSSATEADLSIEDGVLQTRRLSWSGALSTGAAEMRLAALDRGGEAEVYVHSRRIPLLWLLGGEPDRSANRTYRIYLSSRGGTLREVAANLDGAVAYRGGGGRVSNQGLQLIVGDLLDELVSRLNPFARTDPYTDVLCGAGAVRIRSGVIDIDPGVVFRTDKVDVAAGGSIDLRDEQLSVTFRSRPRRGIGISAAKAIAPYIKLGGTLAEPRLVLDPRSAAVSGGTAVATAGLSVIAGSLWDRWIATADNPCDRMFTHISEANRADYAALLERPDIAPPLADDDS